MKNRSNYAVLTRFGILGALLATLAFIAPVVFANAIEVNYAENGTEPVTAFSATDPEGEEIKWSLDGPDAATFTIEGGVLAFKKSPNYEKPTDADDSDDAGDQGKGDNVYKITVKASSSTTSKQDVEVTVTNVDEPGKVTFSQIQPQATRDLAASYSDDDKAKDDTWQWSKGPSATGPWTDIDKATSKERAPTADDVGSWLRATVSYTDSFGPKTVSGVTDYAVVAETLANAAPSFASHDEDKATKNVIDVTREINEGAKGDLGDPLVATDADNDVLIYTKGGIDKDCFSVGRTSGQLSLNAERDFETPTAACTTDGTARTSAADTNRTADGTNDYVVTVTATDPSGASSTVTVTVTVEDVNEAPKFTAAGGKDQKTLYIDENVTEDDIVLRTKEVDDDDDTPSTYVAEDEDAEALDANAAVRYVIEGADKKHFTITDNSATGTLSLEQGDDGDDNLYRKGANHEGKDSYSITIVATSGGTAAATRGGRDRYARLDVTIKVVDGEDAGVVKFPATREPQEGKSVTAELSDPDGGITDKDWKWYRGVTDADNNTAGIQAGCPAVDAAVLTTPGVDGWQLISDATSPVYTPDSDTFNHDNDDGTTLEVGYCLRATVTYKDNIFIADADTGTVGNQPDHDLATTGIQPLETASKVTERPVQADDPANTAPKFKDDNDPNTPGKQPDAERSVKENVKNAAVGAEVVAADDDLLFYKISDTTNFSVDNNGQIKTKVKLDYETQSSYTVVLTATDPSGASDTTNVNITVTDENDPAVISGDKEVDYAENGTGAVATYTATDQDGTDIVWEDLEGVDEALFEIEDGVLSFKKSPNYEDAKDADENKDSLGDQGKGDNKYQVTVQASDGDHKVTVTVTNVDEAGSVTFNEVQPQATVPLEASFSDQDGKKDPTWQWSRGASATGPWTDVSGAATASRTPDTDDVGNYLRATVTYTDSFGEKTVSGVTDNAVEGEQLSNARPSFSALEKKLGTNDDGEVELEINENKKGDFGDPVAAKDDDGDVMLYTLTGGSDKDCFSIDKKTAQLSMNAGRDFEVTTAACKDGGTARDADDRTYPFTVVATDPSGAAGELKVRVTVKDVNEDPKFTDAAKAATQKTLYIHENRTSGGTPALALSTADTGATAAPVGYVAEDEDSDDENTGVTYVVEGADKKHFELSTGGALGFVSTADLATKGANYESKSSYSITIVAESGGTGTGTGRTVGTVDRTKYARLAVTIKVVDGEDDGTVKFPNTREPQEGKAVTATLSDPDGGETGKAWTWYRGVTDADDQTDGIQAGCPAATAAVLTTPGVDGWQLITGASSPVYTPASYTFDHDNDALDTDGNTNPNASAEVGYCLRATVTYTDDIVTDNDTLAADGTITSGTPDGVDDGDTAHGVTERPVQMDDPANTAPKFTDDTDPNTPGNQPDFERSVAENVKGANVGEPVTAEDKDLLMYSVDDTANFAVDNDGQITTAVKLDYETKSEYTVVLTATDPSGASDTTNVNITVTDEDDAPVIVVGPSPDASGPDCSTAVGAGGASLEADCQTLLNIKDELIGDGTATLNWSGDLAIGEWDGVAGTGSGRVTHIHLVGGHANLGGGVLSGVLPAGITALDALQRLTLTNNDLSGDIPDLNGLDSIQWLVLGGNAFTGSIPASLGDLDSLIRLWVHNNDGGFDGGIPAELGSLSSLRYLMLHGNDLMGAIPMEIGNANNLKALYLHNNMLTGSIPASLGGLVSATDPEDTVRLLYLHNNMLSGDVPSELGNLVNLKRLLLSGNMLTGCIPAAIFDAAADAEAAGLMACPAADDGS